MESLQPPQTEYLASHLHALGTRTLIVEQPYTDRHFIEEFLHYYARRHGGHANTCTRIHAFSADITDEQLDRELQRAATGAADDVARGLNDSYLGYSVIRPLPSVPFGRTVLPPRPDLGDGAQIPTLCDYPVHLAGLELHIKGLAFQQQDRAVGACATTAIWVALQRVCRFEGMRAPTPSAISEAAVRYYLPYGRPFPSTGLTTEQIGEALRSHQFAPSVFEVPTRPASFLAQVQTYLRSGIPVILALTVSGGLGHAVTAVGYRAGSYLCSLYHAGLDPARVAHFTRSAVLSRYVGITRWSVNRQRVLDMIWDTTDTMRPGHLRRHLLGLVCYDDGLRQEVSVDAAALSVPCC